MSTLRRDINLEILRVEGYRKFCNKIFNATKFAMLKLDESFRPEGSAKVRSFVLSIRGLALMMFAAHWEGVARREVDLAQAQLRRC